MNPDTGILTELLNTFIAVFSGGFGLLTPKANTLLGLLAGIEIAVAGLFWALKGQDFTASFIKKLLHIGFFVFLVTSWPALTDAIVKSFAIAGTTAAGGTGVNITDPSWIIEEGLMVSMPISDKIAQMSNSANPLTVLSNLGQMIQYGLAMIMILIAFFIIAIQCFITYVEFYIVAVLGLILVPFGVNKHTAFLAEKAIGAVIAQGVKIMVLAFILAVVHPLLVALTLPADPSLRMAFMVLLASGAVAMLAVHAPAMAGGLLSGSPSLNAGAAVSTAVGAAAGFAGAGMAGIAAKNAAATGVGKTIQAAGAMTETGKAGAALGASSSLGPVATVAGATGGAAYGGARLAAEPVVNLAKRMKERFDAGRLDGARFSGNPDAANTPKPLPPASPQKNDGKQGDGMLVAHTAQQAATHLSTSSNGGSGSPTLPKETDDA